MSADSAVARGVVRAAAATLPTHVGERYREQWLADVRDGAEAGISPARIACAALVFAASFDRSFAVTGKARALAENRSRRAVAFAASSTLLTMITAAGFLTSGPNSGDRAFDVFMSASMAFLLVWAAFAAISAGILVWVTPGVSSRVRWGVSVLLAGNLYLATRGSAGFLHGSIAHIQQNLIPGFLLAVIGAGILVGSLAQQNNGSCANDSRRTAKARLFACVGIVLVGAAAASLSFYDGVWVAAFERGAADDIAIARVLSPDVVDDFVLKLARGQEGAAVAVPAWWGLAVVIVVAILFTGLRRGATARQVILATFSGLGLLVLCNAGILLAFEGAFQGTGKHLVRPFPQYELFLMLGSSLVAGAIYAALAPVRPSTEASVPNIPVGIAAR